MVKINQNFARLPQSYLFSDIAHRVDAYAAAHPHQKVIRMGIGTKYREPYANIPTQTIRNNMLAARRRLSRRGIDVPSPHYFRHNFATRERAAGVDNEQLRREMGHTNQETTRQYGGGNFRHNH